MKKLGTIKENNPPERIAFLLGEHFQLNHPADLIEINEVVRMEIADKEHELEQLKEIQKWMDGVYDENVG